MIESPKLACPTCQKTVYWNDDFPFRPFCSERCKLIDFGAWADERHHIPGDHLDDFPEDRLQDS